MNIDFDSAREWARFEAVRRGVDPGSGLQVGEQVFEAILVHKISFLSRGRRPGRLAFAPQLVYKGLAQPATRMRILKLKNIRF